MKMELSEVLKKRYMDRQEARRKFDADNEQNVFLKEPISPPELTKSQTYFGMSPYPCTKPHRLEIFWSILGDCIEYRKEFHFRCDNEEEADELEKLTYSMVFKFNDRWEVTLDDLVVKAKPPRSNTVPNTH